LEKYENPGSAFRFCVDKKNFEKELFENDDITITVIFLPGFLQLQIEKFCGVE